MIILKKSLFLKSYIGFHLIIQIKVNSSVGTKALIATENSNTYQKAIIFLESCAVQVDQSESVLKNLSSSLVELQENQRKLLESDHAFEKRVASLENQLNASCSIPKSL